VLCRECEAHRASLNQLCASCARLMNAETIALRVLQKRSQLEAFGLAGPSLTYRRFVPS